MREKIIKKVSILIIIIMILEMLLTMRVEAYNKLDYPTWKVDETIPLEEIGIRAIAKYRRDYNVLFDEVTFDRNDIYGATPQGMVVTDYHIVFAVCIKKSATEYDGYIYFVDKNTKKIDFAIPVYDGEESTEYGHMNGMAYNPDAKKIFIPWYYTKDDETMVKKIAIFSYNSEGKLQSFTPEIVNQPGEIFAQDMAYDRDEHEYVFNGHDKIWKVPSKADGSLGDTITEYFKFSINSEGNLHDNIWGKQDIEVYGNYIYKGYYEPGVGDGHSIEGYDEEKDDTYHYDPSERFSNAIGVYNKYNGSLEKVLYIPNTAVAGELEGMSFDSDGTMILMYSQMILGHTYAVLYKYDENDSNVNVRRDIPVNEYGVVIPKTTITGEATGVNEDLIRYYNGNNNLGDDHSNYTTRWKDLSNNENGEIYGSKNAVIEQTANGIVRGEETFTDNGSVKLDGENDFVNIGALPEEVYNNVTIESQFLLDNVSNIHNNTEISLVSNGGYELLLNEGKPEFKANINGEYKFVTINEELIKGRVYNITGVFDGKRLYLYIDSVLRGTAQISEDINLKVDETIATDAIVGAKASKTDVSSGYMEGEIYSARIYKRALSQEEIKQNMNADRLAPLNMFANTDNITITINFSEPVPGLTIDDVIVTNGTKGELTRVSNKKYTLTITDIIEGESLEILIDNNSVVDVLGNIGIGTTITRTRDVSKMPTITANTPDITNEKNIEYVIEFDDVVTGFTKDDIIITNGTKGTFTEVEDRKVYTIEVLDSESGEQAIEIENGACYDRSGNPNKEAFKTITIDRIFPTITGVENGAVYNEKVTPEIADLGTGIKAITLIKDGEEVEYENGQDIVIGGVYELTALDNAGNETKVTFTIEKTTNKIEMLYMPTKTSYLQNYEKLNLAGGKIKVSYSDTTNIEVDLTDERVAVTGFSNAVVGEKELTVKFDEKETTFKVNIVATQPIIAITPSSSEYAKSTKITITAVGEKIPLAEVNNYQYAISDSNIKLPTTGWQNYKNGQKITIGEGLTGAHYVWVKQVVDKAGNISVVNQVSGPYLFDNTGPIVTGVKNGGIYEDTIILHTSDSDSGIEKIRYTRYGGFLDYTDGIEITRKGMYAIKVTDKVGNVTEVNFEKRDKVIFTDVSKEKWYYNAVKYVFQNDIIRGYDDYTFAPNDKLTRGMMVTILYRMEGRPAVTGNTLFPDVQDSSKYYYDAVKWATDNKIVSGYDNGNFGPNDKIQRQQLAVILNKYAKYKGKNVTQTNNLKEFTDNSKISSYAVSQMKWAVGAGVISGNENKQTGEKTLNPKGEATRAEVAAMMEKYCKRVGR